MLVAMTVSLIMIFGMVEFFAILSSQVSDGRAVIEMAGQQRSAALRLQADLEGATAPASPWLDPNLALGYTSVREGFGYDMQPIPGAVITAPSSTVQDDTFGDFDDVLCLTTRSTQDPHVASWRRRLVDGDGNPDNDFFEFVTLEGPDAEVIWYSLWADPDEDGIPQPQDTKLYRRHLLVFPSLHNPPMREGVIDEWTRPVGSEQLLLQDFIDFYNYNDISARPEIHIQNGQITVTMWANSLSDLTKRENRFGHRPLLAFVDPLVSPPVVDFVVTDEELPKYFPFELYRHRVSEAGIGTGGSVGSDAYNPVNLFPDLTWLTQSEDRTGNDVVASHMVGFDIKVFDPTAWVIADVLPKWDSPNMDGAWIASDTLVPSDPGYATKTFSGDPPKALALNGRTDAQVIAHRFAPHVGRGAFVDLNYWRYLYNDTDVNAAWINSPNVVNDLVNDTAFSDSMFGPPPAYFRDMNNLGDIRRRGSPASTNPALRAGWRGLVTPTWDTWPTHYENNGFNEDFGVGEPTSDDPNFRNTMDQGNNGFDDDNTNSVDDIGERETSPPYAVPLTSVQITLRMVESDSRQVRQISVKHNFNQGR